jgi:Tol biopolymer transport system component
VSLSSGARVGPYTVVDKLGEGGMGEVFRAHDARLKRDVALKVLPAAAVGDAQRRSRFDREAQVLAALDHPNIARVFGVEMDGDAPVIVMEVVEGATLADRIARGPLPIDETLAIATQMCDGLEAAHERSIVHRDLKPANIKVRPDGTIKILDFGIARVLASDTTADTANSPTMLGGSTDAGIILGTAAYMSPEQARGRAVDKRADIWAFGCIVYEMLAGAPTFGGESTTDILADVVTREPDWSRLPAGVPDRITELLKRCLQKNPKDRLRDIADARFEIEHASRGPAVSRVKAAAPVQTPSSPLRTIGWFAAGAAAATAVVLIASPFRGEPAAPPAPVRTTVSLPPDTTLALGRGSAVALSPDGRLLAFAGRSKGQTQLYLRPLDRFEAAPLAGTDGATNPFFSPDGRWIGFFAAEKLKKVSIDGGAPVTIADALNPRGEAWAADDTIFITASNNSGISRVAARGGKLEPFTTLAEGELSHRWPRLLPDGKTLLFSVWNDAGWEVSRIAAQRTDRQTKTPVVEIGGGYPRYIRDAGRRGFLVYARSEGLLASAFDEASAAAIGQAVPVVDGVLTNLSGGAQFDLSASGALAYVPGSFEESSRDLVWVGRDGKPASPVMTFRGLTRTWALSPDGQRVTRSTTGDVWVDELATGRSTRITTRPELGNFNAGWTGDGTQVFFARGLAADIHFFLRPSDGRDTERQITKAAGRRSPSGMSADGRWLVYDEIDLVTLSDIWVVDVENGQARPFSKTSANESYGQFSPDARWVAYQSNESGRYEVFVRSFPDGQQVLRISTDGGVEPVWSPKGGELFFRALDGRMLAVTFSAGKAGVPQVLFDARAYENGFAVSPDGQRLLLMPLISSEQSATRVNIVLNFLTELRQRVR